MTPEPSQSEFQIFDTEDTKRTLSNRPSRVISHYDFLNQSCELKEKKVRIFLETLFQLVPEEHRKQVLSRLQTKNDFDFQSQVFELLILGLFYRRGWKLITIENPNLSGGRPDFLFKNCCGQELYVEATVVYGMSDEEKKIEKLRKDILHKLDSIVSPLLWLGLKISGNPTRMPKTKPIVQEIARWLEHVHNTKSFRTVSPKILNIEGMVLKIRPMQERYNPDKFTRPFGMERRWNTCPDFNKFLSRTLAKKFDKYKDLNAPLVIAVNNTQVCKHFHTLKSTLYGVENPEKQISSEPSSGLWKNRGHWKNTQVGAVLLFHRLNAWDVARRTAVLEKHPMAKHKLPFLNLPLGTIVENDHRYIQEYGKQMYIPFGLSEAWPEK